MSDVEGGLVVSADNPLDFHDEIYNVLSISLKYFLLVEIINNFVCHLLQNDFCQENNSNRVFLAFLSHFQ